MINKVLYYFEQLILFVIALGWIFGSLATHNVYFVMLATMTYGLMILNKIHKEIERGNSR